MSAFIHLRVEMLLVSLGRASWSARNGTQNSTYMEDSHQQVTVMITAPFITYAHLRP